MSFTFIFVFKMFFTHNSADLIASRGDIAFNLRHNINLPNNAIGYVSLNELTICNTDYNININTNKNTLVFQDYLGLTQSITTTPGNHTVSLLMSALKLALLVGNNFANITLTYSDITNMYTFTKTENTTHILTILAPSTMNAVLDFEPVLVNYSVANSNMTCSSLQSTSQNWILLQSLQEPLIICILRLLMEFF